MTPLDEAARMLVDGSRLPPFHYAIGPDDARRALRLVQAPPAAMPGVEHRVVAVPTAAGDLTTHVLTPSGPPAAPRPIILYAHGGGWLTGGWETHHRLAVRMCRDTGAIVVMPAYTRVPEARHPVATGQLAAALGWIRAGLPAGADLPADRDRIALVGDCAGATMTLELALREGGAARTLVLLYPLGLPAAGDRSAQAFATGAGLRLADVRHLHQRYAPRAGYPDPLAAEDVRGLPPTLLITAEVDPTRDTAERLGARLRAAGVPVTAARYLGTVHDFAVLDALRWTPAAEAALGQVTDHLRDAFGVVA
ncbi:alpha/beta hydrolase fold domain-containing protein [Actinoplanes missouriensis]|uniref:alpha/beta hydrolase fold domain-containing protein n=1 Tax=Actinoplanes missouriensis TaxID=1866 RepID=UPI0033CC505A